MTGCELSTFLCLHDDFCEWYCGKGCHNDELCFECRHDLAYDMYVLALDMLETA